MATGDSPDRVRVLVLGGGINGVGVLHDLASRGWIDCHLMEKSSLGSGTSSRSTKLIHGGLRYLQRLGQFPMVAESLRERRLLLELASDIVHPLELILPLRPGSGPPAVLARLGLTLYDALAGRSGLSGHRRLDPEAVAERIPGFRVGEFRDYFSFWDAQVDDLALVRRVARSATGLGATYREGCEAVAVRPTPDGWVVRYRDQAGQYGDISALYVVNALGPWSNAFLTRAGLVPTHVGLNNKGCHLVAPDLGLATGLFLPSIHDRRIFFVLPWAGKTLIGTTETLHQGSPDDLSVAPEEVEYLLSNFNAYFRVPLTAADIEHRFAGLRWLAQEEGRGLSATSRETIIGELPSRRGLLLSIYGGKLTSYRSLARRIGDRICRHFGEFRASQTHSREFWSAEPTRDQVESLSQRFGAAAAEP